MSENDDEPDGSSSDPQFEERVGYRHPPRKFQWTPGNSGNGAGRPPNKHSRKFKVERAAYRPVSIRVNGRARSMPALEAIIYVIKHKAIGGNAEAIKLRERLLGISQLDDADPTPQAYFIRREKMDERQWLKRYGYLGDDPRVEASEVSTSSRSP
jgi:hypothetical protein